MKNNKSYLFLLALLLCSSSVLSSCGDDAASGESVVEDSAVSETVPETEADPLASLEDRDLSGRTFTILDANDYPTAHLNMPGELNGDPINDGLYNRNIAIETRYNADIGYVQIAGAAAGIGELRNSVMSGDNAFDLTIPQTATFGNVSQYVYSKSNTKSARP